MNHFSIFDTASALPARAISGPHGAGVSCHVDFETRSTVDLAKFNAYVYAESPDTDIWCAAIAFGDEDPFLWTPDMPVPPRLAVHILAGGEIVAWNAAFERLIIREIAGPRYGWPVPADEQYRCVMVESYAMNLPGKLEKAGPALGLSDVKDVAGHRLMMQMSKPRRIEKDGTIIWWDDESRRERLYEYCLQDVVSERAAEKRLFRLIPAEREAWLLDLKMNDRGVYIDAELCTVAKRLAAEATAKLDARMNAVTDGDVFACSNVGQLIKWLKDNGVDTDTVKKDALADLLAREDISPACREALELRKAAAKTSTAKIDKLLDLRQRDGRMRGTVQFIGAAQTGRWCLTGDSEVLTHAGWVRLDQYTGGEIMQWSPTGDLRFGRAQAQAFRVDQAPMLRIRHAHRMDATMTLEHVIPGFDKNGAFKPTTALALAGAQHRSLPLSGVVRTAPRTSTLQTRILVMLQHDGYDGDYSVEWSFVKKRKSTRCQKLLASAGVRYTATWCEKYSRWRIRVAREDAPAWLRKRDFGSWLLQEAHDPRAFIDECQYWDGGGHDKSKNLEVCCAKRENAEWTVTMAHLAGKAGVVTERRNGSGRSYYYANIRDQTHWHKLPSDDEMVVHDGVVFCPATETGFFLCRSNGLIWVSGNSGRGAQLQNLPRPEAKLIDELVATLQRGDLEWLEMVFGDPMTAIADAIRSMITAAPGRTLLDADFSNIEGRVIAWLAGESTKLARFRAFDAGTGPDVYLVAAAGIYNVAVDAAKPYRQVGKVSELACIAEGQQVLTDRGLVPIEQVKQHDRLWDGVEFVGHCGIVCQGTKEVIEHDGLTATRDHIVWVEGERGPVRFGDAAARGQRLLRSGDGGRPLRVGGGDIAGTALHSPMVGLLRAGPLHGLQPCRVGVVEQPQTGQEPGVPSLFATGAGPALATEAGDGHARPMHEPEGRRLGPLRRAGVGVPVPERAGRGAVDTGEPGAGPISGVGPDRQQRPLRARQPAVCDTGGKQPEPAPVETYDGGRRVGADTEPSREARDATVSLGGLPKGGDYRVGIQGGPGEAQELARHSGSAGLARVYDILNCGPRNRFTVSGALVHNCGFGGGVGAFVKMAANYGLKVADTFDTVWASSDDERRERAQDGYKQRGAGSGLSERGWLAAECIKLGWRAEHPETVALWAGLEAAALAAVQDPERGVHSYRSIKYRMVGSFLFCLLPSGRTLVYPYPRVEQKPVPWKNADGTQARKPAIVYKCEDGITRKWADTGLYGGMLAQHATQGTARDVMRDAMMRVEAEGFEVVLTIHDEILTETTPELADLERFKRVMAEVPAWAEGLPIAVDGWVAERFRK